MNSDRQGHVQVIREELARDERRAQARPIDPAQRVIELRDVFLTFDHPILQGVDLDVRQGETLHIVGESGTGKSTILKLVMRLLQPDRGTVRVFGEDIAAYTFQEALELRRRIGMVFQNAALFDSLNIYENIAYPLRENTDMDEDDIERTVREKLDFVDLDPDRVMPQLPSELSGGMRKRVGIARAIATDPEVVLYDEPTAGLDPLTVGTINDLIRKLQRELGVTSVLVSHDIRAGFRVANRVSLLREGRIRFTGTPEEMVAADDPYINAFLS
ncbi:MAG TPA: ATP-binding cassette domain-containing protein [Longimicrobiales bacterium]